ncbi:SAICAR synthase-like protein [Gymnopus androsaceus JB14]|uniref:Kinase n=1 Tax=Gymnopus androsaceus JB14 TaxID=1447944 RepID=A0A6A4GRS3_9AGAR|nr:SAICAR synthase-like protein [Gymnopus androsaceus JB14]
MSSSNPGDSSSSFIQVGGHPGSVSTTEDDSFIIKQSTQLEMEFYSIMAQARAMAKLGRFVSQFYGTLRLEGEMDVEAMSAEVLENALKPFLKPNILDLKLGRVLYDQDAPEKKKTRMQQVAQQTTSGECGMRLTGFQVHSQSPSSAGPVITSKSYGKSLRKDQLPEGIARVFPTAITPSSPTTQPTDPTVSLQLGLSAQTLLPILSAIHDSTTHLRDVLASLEIRIVGGSLLVVYEGDEESAQEGVRWMEERVRLMEEREDMDQDDASDEESEESESPPYTIKLIDFAHTRFVPGQGPDEGVLLGLNTFLGLIKGRIEEVKLMMGRLQGLER